MDEARAYPGAVEFILDRLRRGDKVSVVSHKTRHPFMGPKHDLHVAARGWIAHHLQPQLNAAGVAIGVHFELTKGEKLARIGQCNCYAFIDDLPEILLAPEFPAPTRALLFDPDGTHSATTLTRFDSWASLSEFFERS